MADKTFPEKAKDSRGINAESIRLITEEIGQFTRTWLGFSPKMIDVDFHQQAIAVTLAGILTEAEKNAVRYNGVSELIVKNHVGAYKSIRTILETNVAKISGLAVAGSALMLDTESNCATLIFKFE